MDRWGRFTALALVLLAISARAAADAAPEYAVKAAYLAKFGAYVDWPNGSASGTLHLCIAGTDAFGDVLDKTANGQHVGDREVTVERVKTLARGSDCQIAYIGGSDAQSVAQALDAVRGAPILTVTDSEHGDTAGVVHFVIKDDRVRFDIDDQAAATNGLTISSKLLGLALAVKPRQ